MDSSTSQALPPPEGDRNGLVKWALNRSHARLLIQTACAVVAVIITLAVLNYFVSFYIAKTYVDEVSETYDLDRNLARALTWASFAFAAFFVSSVFSFSKKKRALGYSGILLLVVSHAVVLWHGSRDEIVGTKCFMITPTEVAYGNRHGVDPKSGRECKPISAKIAQALREYEKGRRPRLLDRIKDDEFFDSRTGEPLIWYYLRGNKIEMFDLVGFHPVTAEELKPVTRDVVENYKQQLEQARAPQLVDLEKVVPFDPITGHSRLWFSIDSSGEYRFYDRGGFDPETGDPLRQTTRDTLKERAARSVRKCYVITNDKVAYGDAPGIDAATGRECRELQDSGV